MYWYVRAPNESGLGTNVETDTGNSTTTTASLTYTFPSSASDDYVITAYVYPQEGDVYQLSYTVSVSSGNSPDPDPNPDPDPDPDPDPTPILCGNSWTGAGACIYGRVFFGTDPNEHQATCVGGHTYWSCNTTAVERHEETYVCSRSGCATTFTKCTNTSGACLNTKYLYHKLSD